MRSRRGFVKKWHPGISKKSVFLDEKLIFEILPLFFAITVVTLPKLPGKFCKTTLILDVDCCLEVLFFSHEISNHLSGLSE